MLDYQDIHTPSWRELAEFIDDAGASIALLGQEILRGCPEMQSREPSVASEWQKTVAHHLDKAGKTRIRAIRACTGMADRLIGWIENPGDLETDLMKSLASARAVVSLIHTLKETSWPSLVSRKEQVAEKCQQVRQSLREVADRVRFLRDAPATNRGEDLTTGGRQPGDDLIRHLASQSDEMAAVAALPKALREPSMLTVTDYAGLIEFGGRNCHWIGSGDARRLVVEQGWSFSSLTGPRRKPMAQIIAKEIALDGDECVRLHVRLTHLGRTRAALLVLAEHSDSGANAGLGPEPPIPKARMLWTEVQDRLMEMYTRGDRCQKQEGFAKLLGCGVATISKAFHAPDSALKRLNSDERQVRVANARKLRGWMKRHARRTGSVRTSRLSEVDLDSIASEREADPLHASEQKRGEAVLDLLLEECHPKQRARIQEMSPGDREAFIDRLWNDEEFARDWTESKLHAPTGQEGKGDG